jgi:hypothetical protein
MPAEIVAGAVSVPPDAFSETDHLLDKLTVRKGREAFVGWRHAASVPPPVRPILQVLGSGREITDADAARGNAPLSPALLSRNSCASAAQPRRFPGGHGPAVSAKPRRGIIAAEGSPLIEPWPGERLPGTMGGWRRPRDPFS